MLRDLSVWGVCHEQTVFQSDICRCKLLQSGTSSSQTSLFDYEIDLDNSKGAVSTEVSAMVSAKNGRAEEKAAHHLPVVVPGNPQRRFSNVEFNKIPYLSCLSRR